MKVIGVTGGVGCGKSEIMHFLEETYDCFALRLDELARQQMEPGGASYAPVRELFPDCMQADGRMDRGKIAAVVFSDPEKLSALNAVTHPLVRSGTEELIRQKTDEGVPLFFLETALLLEEKYDEICDEVWYVYADENVRRQRLSKSRGYSQEKITQMMASQKPEAAFRAAADFVIDNSGSLECATRQIEEHLENG